MSTTKDEFEKEGNKKKKQPVSRTLLFISLLVVALVWGSVLLIHTISDLQATTLKLRQQQLLKSLDHQQCSVEVENLGFDGINQGAFASSPSLKRIGISEFKNDTFRPHFKPIQWISEPNSHNDDKGLYATKRKDAYVIKSMENDNYEQLLFNGTGFTDKDANYTIDKFTSSPDLKYALIQTNRTKNWRHSSFGIYWVLNVETQELTQLHPEKLSIAQWSPTSDKVAIVLNNNFFVYKVGDHKMTQVTQDGSSSIFNGKPDWVYEEEVFEGDIALWWSPNGEYVAFLRTNDTEVPQFPIPYFVQGNGNDIYPELRKIKYPKAGFPNPIVQLALFDVKDTKLTYIDYFDDIFTEVLWVGNDQLLLKTTNRSSDFLKVVLIDAKDLSFKIVRDEKADGWFEITHDTFFVPKSNSVLENGYIDTVSVNGYNHIAYFTPASNSTPKLLTQGKWEVVSAPTAFDYSKNLVYYISTQESSIERHLHSVNILTGETKKYTEGEGWFSASFSSGARFVSLNNHGPKLPSQALVDLYTGKTKSLSDNDKLASLLSEYELPVTKWGEVDIGTAVVNYMETLPPNFDPTKKHPVLFFVYGGPGSQLVQKIFSQTFSTVVASQLNAVVVTVDGRGTGFKGRGFRSLVRDKLGTYEVIDQIAAAKHWGKKEYIDENRVAMFGWSYGGFMTLKTLEADAGETFQYGMSVAPVTDFRLYDSVYTERYMHLPQDNAEGYAKTAVTNVTNIGKATRFLLMHGSGDDNVHVQNTLKVLDQFDLHSVQNYDLHIFPDSDHAIRFHNADYMVYNKLLNWLKKAFNGDYVVAPKKKD